MVLPRVKRDPGRVRVALFPAEQAEEISVLRKKLSPDMKDFVYDGGVRMDLAKAIAFGALHADVPMEKHLTGEVSTQGLSMLPSGSASTRCWSSKIIIP